MRSQAGNNRNIPWWGALITHDKTLYYICLSKHNVTISQIQSKSTNWLRNVQNTAIKFTNISHHNTTGHTRPSKDVTAKVLIWERVRFMIMMSTSVVCYFFFQKLNSLAWNIYLFFLNTWADCLEIYYSGEKVWLYLTAQTVSTYATQCQLSLISEKHLYTNKME